MPGSSSVRAAVLAAAAALSLAAGPACAGEMTRARFAAIMDATFGAGAWRMTGGYRTPEREDQLRAQGAMTVPPGRLSRHSLGGPDAPGAFDLVVNGMSPYEAADRLRQAGAPFAKYQPKGTHGSQGPHLHLEPYGFGPVFQFASTGSTKASGKVDAKAEPGRLRSVVLTLPAVSARDAAAMRRQLANLRAGAEDEEADAQLELGRAYSLGYLVPRDFAQARSWLQAATENPDADPDLHAEALAALAEVTELLEAERAQRGAQVAQLSGGGR